MNKLEINKHLLLTLFLCGFSFFRIDVYAKKDAVGKYVGKESNRFLFLKEDGRYYLINDKRGVMFYHIDTLSFGTWKQDESFVVLNISKSVESGRLKVLVEESFNPNSDSLVLEIFNPYEDFSRKYENGHRIFQYLFSIDSNDGRFGPEILMKSNRISLLKTNNDKIVNMVIDIVPNSYLYPSSLAYNYLTTDVYLFKNRNSNHIKVTIPDFTFEYIGYERFREEYVKIKKKDLILRGERFEKEAR